MKLLKKFGSIFIAVCLMLNVFVFVSAARVSEGTLREFLAQFPLGNDEEYSSGSKPCLRQYPKANDALVQLLLDVKVDDVDIDVENDNSLASRLYSIRVDKKYLESGSPWIEMFIFLHLTSAADGYKFVSNYKFDRAHSSFDPLHFCCKPKFIDNNGNEKVYFRWIDKEKCKETVKQMMDGTFDVREIPLLGNYFKNDDRNLLFFKHIQDAIIKYLGGIDAFFNDDELSTKFFSTMLEESSKSGKSSFGNEKTVTMVSTGKSEEVNSYKKLGQDIVTKTLEYKGLAEGKDYEIVYNEETGYIKEIRKVSNNFLILVCIFLAVVVVALAVVLIVILTKKKR